MKPMEKEDAVFHLKPMISVITVTRNAAYSVGKTVRSIIVQETDDIEFILVDGDSSDNTVEIVRDIINSEMVKPFVYKHNSEPDKGVYDAMNKGVHMAEGEYVMFLNAGDFLYSQDVLSRLKSAILENPNVDVFYGDTLMCFYEGRGIYDGEAGLMRNPVMPFIHQSSIVRRSLLIDYPFDLSYKIIADYVFFKKLRDNDCIFHHLDMIISEYDAKEGLSENNPLMIRYEQDRADGLAAEKFYWARKIALRCTVGLIQPIKDFAPRFILNQYFRKKKTYIKWQDSI